MIAEDLCTDRLTVKAMAPAAQNPHYKRVESPRSARSGTWPS